MDSLLGLALSNAILAAMLAAVAAIIACLCRRPTVRHALWLLVLLKLITPPLIPLSVTWPRSEDSELAPAEASLPVIFLPESLESPANDRRQPAGEATHESTSEAPNKPADAGRSPDLFWMPLLGAVWLGGALAWWTIAAVRVRKFQRLLRQARPAPEDVQEQARRLAALLRLRRCPPVALVSVPLSPMLWALGLSPRLLLPSELWPRLEKEQQDTLLAHELAHLRRGDHWVRRLEFVVLGLYWWHPVVWWARRRLQEAEEECCDAVVIAVLPDAAPAYASALVETVAFLSQCRASALVGASGAGQVPLLKRRLTMILMTTSPRRPSRLVFWIVLGLGALLLPLAPRAARTQAPEEPAPKESPRQENAKLQRGESQRAAARHDQGLDPLVAAAAAAAERNRGEEIENLQDEIELLKLKVQSKDARRTGTQAKLKDVKRRLSQMMEINRQHPGTIPFDTIQEVRVTETGLMADAAVQEIEWKEGTVLLKQAERRLARIQRPAEKTDGGGRAQQEKRLRELEQKVENLLKEIRKMRKDMPPDKPRDQGLAPKDCREFIDRVWPTLDTTRLEDNIPKAVKAFQKCKDVGDRTAIQELLKGTEGHVIRLAKELTELHPELVVDDVEPARKLQKVSEQMLKLRQDIADYLKAHPE